MKKYALMIITLLLLFSFSSCKEKVEEKVEIPQNTGAIEMTIYIPEGEQGNSLSALSEKAANGECEDIYEIVPATTQELLMAVVHAECDMAVIPPNMVPSLYNSKGGFKVVGITGISSAVLVEKGSTITDLSQLSGKTVYSMGEGDACEAAFGAVLAKYGIDAENEVAMAYPGEIDAIEFDDGSLILLEKSAAQALLANDSSYRIAFDIAKEWRELYKTEPVGSVLIADEKFIEVNNPAFERFLVEFTNSANEALDAYVPDFETDTQTVLQEYFNILKENFPLAVGDVPVDNIYR